MFSGPLTLVAQDRYRELLRVSRQWRNLKAWKEHGVGYADHLQPGKGSLAIVCPACPRPGVNLRPGWEKDPEKLVNLDLSYGTMV